MGRRPADREPTVEVRRRKRGDGSVSEELTVRYYDDEGVRRRKSFVTEAEADFERARLAFELSRGGRLAGPAESLTVAEFWPTYYADAMGRLEENTVVDYGGSWRRRLEPRFGSWRLDEITPREISKWRTDMQKAGVGPEAIRKAMVLLQAMFTLAVEWGESNTNPVSLVRKPPQGRQRAIEVMDPATVELVRREMLSRGALYDATLVSVLAYSGGLATADDDHVVAPGAREGPSFGASSVHG
jgi:hypothetical protein